MSKSYFPLLIVFIKTNEQKVVHSPDELVNVGSFKVLETNYNK